MNSVYYDENSEKKFSHLKKYLNWISDMQSLEVLNLQDNGLTTIPNKTHLKKIIWKFKKLYYYK